MKYFMLVVLIAIACSKRNESPVIEIKPESKVEKVPYKQFFKQAKKKVLLPHKEPIALVYHVNINTIFHCSSVNHTECGLTAECGDDKLVCIKNTKVEYLNRSY